jgi:hypothetical protein
MKISARDAVDTDVLREELERALSETGDVSPYIAHLARRVSGYRTSFALEELEVFLEDGRHLQIIWKNLHHHSLDETARHVKPEFLLSPAREIEMYRQILMPHRLSTPSFYGAVVRPEEDRYWLFLERVAGRELYQIGDFRIWQQVARWLAGMHSQFREQVDLFQRDVPLIVHDSSFYRQWMTRACEFAAGTKAAIEIERLAERHNQVIERLLALERTLLHGEFYASNILVVPQANSLRVCPVDWEMAAVGPGLQDLGALIAGHWSEEEKRELASAYYSALPMPREWSWEEFLEALDYCRLQIAVQWLGWSPDWSPPPEHAQDWLCEAISLAEKLKL